MKSPRIMMQNPSPISMMHLEITSKKDGYVGGVVVAVGEIQEKGGRIVAMIDRTGNRSKKLSGQPSSSNPFSPAFSSIPNNSRILPTS